MSHPSTRDQILSTARRLFNERGYARVTMRALADALGISVGNVTYHFARKQDIVAALMDGTFEEAPAGGEITSLEGVNALLSYMLDSLTRNAFFFLDEEFSESARHLEHHVCLRSRLTDGLNALAGAGLFLPSFTPETCRTLVTLLMMSHMTWLHQTVRGPALYAMDKAAFLRAQWTALAPYLSPAGLEAYAQIKNHPPFTDP